MLEYESKRRVLESHLGRENLPRNLDPTTAIDSWHSWQTVLCRVSSSLLLFKPLSISIHRLRRLKWSKRSSFPVVEMYILLSRLIGCYVFSDLISISCSWSCPHQTRLGTRYDFTFRRDIVYSRSDSFQRSWHSILNYLKLFSFRQLLTCPGNRLICEELNQ
jgi:hypothetical protein